MHAGARSKLFPSRVVTWEPCSILPPGPPGGFIASVRTLRDPFGALVRFARQYGDPFTISLPLQGQIVVTADPVAIRSVFAADPDTFGSSGAKVMTPILGPGSVVALEGAAHRRARKLLNPPFHGDRMRAHGRLMRDVARERTAHLVTGTRFTVQHVAEAISLEVILQAIFGVRGTDRVARFERAVRGVMGRSARSWGLRFCAVRSAGSVPGRTFSDGGASSPSSSTRR